MITIIIITWILLGVISGLIAARAQEEDFTVKHLIVVTLFGYVSFALLIIAYIIAIFIDIFESKYMKGINKFLNKKIKL